MNEHFSTFTTDTEQRFQNDFKANEPDHHSHDSHDRTSDHVGTISLGRNRWQLSNHPAIFLHAIPWAQVFWLFFQKHLLDEEDTYLLAGDECVVTKAGKETYGLDYFFSGLLKKAVPSLSFFTLALVSVKQRRSYPIQVEQTVRSSEEKASSQVKKQAKKAKSDAAKAQTRTSQRELQQKEGRSERLIQNCNAYKRWCRHCWRPFRDTFV